ncbi:MAG: hypothetical protein LBL73_00080 [Synergistaceae bacterium]|jgi:hypothetical protein|nr:hypothetical protein [Synergistaceae bacterium]
MKTQTRPIDLFALALIITAACLAAAPAADAGPKVYKNNVLTAQHVTIPGTHVAIVPPGGAKLSSSFAGFEIEPRNVRCEITETLTPYANTAATLTPEDLEGEKIKAQDISDVDLNGKPAKIIAGTSVSDDDEDIGIVMLVTGNERMTVTIRGYYPQSDRAAATQLRNSVLSVILEPKQKESATESYTISAAGTEFQMADQAGETKRFTVGGQPFSSSLKDATFVSTSFTQAIDDSGRQEFAEGAAGRFLSQYEYTILSSRNINYGGLPGIEITADVKGNYRTDRTASGGTVRRQIPARGYVAVLFDPNSDLVFSFTGIAVINAESYLSQFIRITSTFSRPQP